MSYLTYYTNPYSYPENRGVSILVSKDVAGDYEFAMFVVWTDGQQLYYATDSGCSCPTPFEDLQLKPTEEDEYAYDYSQPRTVKITPLSETLDPASKDAIYSAVDAWVADRSYYLDSEYDRERLTCMRQAALDIKEKVRGWTPK